MHVSIWNQWSFFYDIKISPAAATYGVSYKTLTLPKCHEIVYNRQLQITLTDLISVGCDVISEKYFIYGWNSRIACSD